VPNTCEAVAVLFTYLGLYFPSFIIVSIYVSFYLKYLVLSDSAVE
jgi:hypothetical protein